MSWYMCIVGDIHKVNKKERKLKPCAAVLFMLLDVNCQDFSLGEPNDIITVLDATSVVNVLDKYLLPICFFLRLPCKTILHHTTALTSCKYISVV
jgi:hypothetical protein